MWIWHSAFWSHRTTSSLPSGEETDSPQHPGGGIVSVCPSGDCWRKQSMTVEDRQALLTGFALPQPGSLCMHYTSCCFWVSFWIWNQQGGQPGMLETKGLNLVMKHRLLHSQESPGWWTVHAKGRCTKCHRAWYIFCASWCVATASVLLSGSVHILVAMLTLSCFCGSVYGLYCLFLWFICLVFGQ